LVCIITILLMPRAFLLSYALNFENIREDILSLSTQQVSKLNRIIFLAEKLIAEDRLDRRNGAATYPRRIRRAGKELAQFRKMLKAERRKGIPVATLAHKHGISSAYIYMLP
jgi:hypothetical protein